MSQSTATGATGSRNIEGVICVVIGMCFFVVQDGLMKSMLGPFTIWMLIAARGVMSVLIMVPIILWLGRPHRLFTPFWRLHLLRAFLFASGFSLFYTAFPFMGLAEVSTIFFSAPLMIALLAAFWLGETLGPHRIGAVVVGFIGVVIAMNPGGDTFSWIAVLPLICAATYSCSQIIARTIGDRETSLTMGLYTVAFSGVLILPAGWVVNSLFDLGAGFNHLRWEWWVFAPDQIARLAGMGTVGLVGYTLLSRAYQIASASLIAPFDYTYLPLVTVMAWLVWGEVPTVNTLVGMALIVASGLYIGYRELRVRDPQADGPPPVAESVMAPGNPVPVPTAEDFNND